MGGDTYHGRWAMCDCNSRGRVVSLGSVVWITPRWSVAVTLFMGGPRGPRVGVVAGPLISPTSFVGWTMRSLRARYVTVTFSKSSACCVMVGRCLGVRGSCRACATVRLVSSANPTKGERRG